jgi:hypothetical protein
VYPDPFLNPITGYIQGIFSDNSEVLPIPKAGNQSIDTNINGDIGASMFVGNTGFASKGASLYNN